MNKNHNKHNRVETVFVLMIFCVFAASVFFVIIFSGSIYRNIVDISKHGQNERIALSYIRTKVKNADSAGGITLSNFNGLSALSLEEVFEERTFVTYIYLYEGWIYELFHEKGLDFLPTQGVPIIKAESLYFESVDKDLIRASTNFGSLLIYLRSTAAAESEGF